MLIFLVQHKDVIVIKNYIFKMLPVISSDLWQQALYHPSAKSDNVTST